MFESTFAHPKVFEMYMATAEGRCFHFSSFVLCMLSMGVGSFQREHGTWFMVRTGHPTYRQEIRHLDPLLGRRVVGALGSWAVVQI